MFSEAKYAPKWKSTYDDLLEDFAGKLALVMKKPNVHYASTIVKAGNAQQRTEVVKRLVRELKEPYNTLAPNLETEIGEDTGDEPTAEEYFRSRNMEIRFRDCVHSVLLTSQGENWYAKVPEKTRQKIEDDVILRKAHGEEGLETKPSRGWLDSSTLSDLFLTISDDKNWPLFKDYMSGSKKVFEQYFSDFMLLRNIIMHGKTFPSKIAKTRCLAALEYFEELQVHFP